MNIKIQQAENSIENVSNSVLSALYNAHTNGDISQEVDENNQKIGLIGSIQVDVGYENWISTLTSAYPKFHASCNTYYILFYHQEIENAIITWAQQNPNNVGANFASGGHITQADADSLTSWGKTFTGNTNITQFNEFEKFRNVTQVSQNDCFQGCTNLQSIKLPPRLTNIRGWMFNGCSSLSGVVLPASCTTIDTAGFAGCTSLTSIDLSNVQTIGYQAFYKSGLSGVLSLPSLIQIHEREAFAQCEGLTEVDELGSIITVPWSTFNKCSNITSVTLPQTCTSLGNAAFESCSKLSSINLSNIQSFGNSVFQNDVAITGELSLPNLTSCGEWTFANTRITSVTNLGSTISNISIRMFCDCSQLTSVILPSSVTTIDAYGFCNCIRLTSLDVSNITTFGQGALKNTRITSLDLSSAISIGSEAFSNNSALTTVTGTSNLTSIGNDAFQNCSGLTSIDLSNVQSIGNSAFDNCPLNSINIPNVTTIGSYAFLRRSGETTNLQLSSSITNIGKAAFARVNDSNSCFYFPNFIGNNNTSDLFSHYYSNAYVSTIGQLYLPHLTGTYTQGHGSYPYWTGLCETLKAQLVYLKDITDFYPGMFSNSDIQAIVINNTTPPTLNNSTDNRQEEGAYNTAIFNVVNNWSGFIYVPDGYVNTYIQAWENVLDSTRESSAGSTIRTDITLKNRIKPISELPTYATEADWIEAGRPLGLITAYMN